MTINHHKRGNKLYAAALCCLLLNATASNSQSAIGQLENLTGQNIGVFTPTGNSGLGMIQSAIPLIFNLFKGNPEKEQQMLEEQQRLLEKTRVENEQQSKVKEALQQFLHDRLMGLYKPLPETGKIEIKAIVTPNSTLTPKGFDGDKQDYLYKGESVLPAIVNIPEVEEPITLFEGKMTEENVKTLLDPYNDPAIVDLRDAESLVVRSLKENTINKEEITKTREQKDGEPIFQQPTCTDLFRSISGYEKELKKIKSNVDVTNTEMKEWEKKKNEALKEALNEGLSFLTERFLDHMVERGKRAQNILGWMDRFEPNLIAKGVDVNSYRNLLNLKIMGGNLSQLGLDIFDLVDRAQFIKMEIQLILSKMGKNEEAVKRLLEDPHVKEFFDEEHPVTEMTSAILEEEIEGFLQTDKLNKLLGKYFSKSIPYVSIASFAVNQAYNLMDASLSFYTTLQLRDANGKLTDGARYLQSRINDNFELLKTCK
jgi:hypothetical protein